MHYLGQWKTPYWEGDVDKGPRFRAGFGARTHITRHDFGVSWSDYLDRSGVVVSDEISISIDVEAIRTTSEQAGPEMRCFRDQVVRDAHRMADDRESALAGGIGDLGSVVCAGDTVRRPWKPIRPIFTPCSGT